MISRAIYRYAWSSHLTSSRLISCSISGQLAIAFSGWYWKMHCSRLLYHLRACSFLGWIEPPTYLMNSQGSSSSSSSAPSSTMLIWSSYMMISCPASLSCCWMAYLTFFAKSIFACLASSDSSTTFLGYLGSSYYDTNSLKICLKTLPENLGSMNVKAIVIIS